MLSYLKYETLKIFYPHINYANFVWAQNSNPRSRIFTLQKTPWELLISSQSFLFSKLKLLKFNDKVVFENVLLISKFIISLLQSFFNNWFTFCSNIHNYETTSSAICKLFKHSFRSNLYAKNTITIKAMEAWNKAQTSLSGTIFKDNT